MRNSNIMMKLASLFALLIFSFSNAQLFSRTVQFCDDVKQRIFMELYSSYSDQIKFDKMEKLEDSLALKHIKDPKIRERMLEFEAFINSQCGTGRREIIQKTKDITTKEFYDEFSFLVDEIKLHNKENAGSINVVWMREKFSPKTEMQTLLKRNNWEQLKHKNNFGNSVIGIVFNKKLLYMVIWYPNTNSTDVFRYKLNRTNKKWNLIH